MFQPQGDRAGGRQELCAQGGAGLVIVIVIVVIVIVIVIVFQPQGDRAGGRQELCAQGGAGIHQGAAQPRATRERRPRTGKERNL